MATQNRDPNVNEAQRNVEETRRQMNATLDAISARLQPQQLFGQLRDSVRDGVRDAANGTTEQLLGSAREKAQEARSALLDAVRSTPFAATLASVGMGWLLNQGAARVRGQAETTVRQAQESLQQAASDAQERVQAKAGELGGAAREQLQQLEAWLQRATGGAPLAFGALALAAGVILGFTLPASPQEQELLSEVRESLRQQAHEIAQDATERAQRVAAEARDAAGRAARGQGLIH